MIQVVHCSHCSGTGELPVQVEVTVKSKLCSSCHSDQSTRWSYYFCGSACFLAWVKSMDDLKGVPCQDCWGYLKKTKMDGPTGWAFGHEQNGPCETCSGKKVVSVS